MDRRTDAMPYKVAKNHFVTYSDMVKKGDYKSVTRVTVSLLQSLRPPRQARNLPAFATS